MNLWIGNLIIIITRTDPTFWIYTNTKQQRPVVTPTIIIIIIIITKTFSDYSLFQTLQTLEQNNNNKNNNQQRLEGNKLDYKIT